MTQIKLILLGVILAALAGTLTTCYFKGRTDATQKTDLATARAAIKESRERQKIEHATNTRVDAEGVQTEQTAKAADDEIERIRERQAARPVVPREVPHLVDATRPMVPAASDRVDADAARVMQLAREARAAAIESAARLQSAGTGTR